MSSKETHSRPVGTGSGSGSPEGIPPQQTRTKSRSVENCGTDGRGGAAQASCNSAFGTATREAMGAWGLVSHVRASILPSVKGMTWVVMEHGSSKQ